MNFLSFGSWGWRKGLKADLGGDDSSATVM